MCDVDDSVDIVLQSATHHGFDQIPVQPDGHVVRVLNNRTGFELAAFESSCAHWTIRYSYLLISQLSNLFLVQRRTYIGWSS